jgi:hypothetical protein
MPATYESIATTTTTGNVILIEFENIPQTYTDLIAIAEIKNTVATAYNMIIRVGNNTLDSGTNYTSLYLTSGQSNNPSAGLLRNQNRMAEYAVGPRNNNDHMAIINFMDYSNTSTWKTVLQRSSMASLALEYMTHTWRSTSAINRIGFSIDFSAINVASGSTVTLYGIKAA